MSTPLKLNELKIKLIQQTKTVEHLQFLLFKLSLVRSCRVVHLEIFLYLVIWYRTAAGYTYYNRNKRLIKEISLLSSFTAENIQFSFIYSSYCSILSISISLSISLLLYCLLLVLKDFIDIHHFLSVRRSLALFFLSKDPWPLPIRFSFPSPFQSEALVYIKIRISLLQHFPLVYRIST